MSLYSQIQGQKPNNRPQEHV